MPERKVSDKQVAALLKLDGPKRYDHFIKHVVDCEQAWGLYADGWAMGSDDEGAPTFQLWPAKEYAALCAVDDWSECAPRAIPLDELIEVVLPQLKDEGASLGVFRTPEGQSVIPPIDRVLIDLETEMSRYE